VTPRRKLVKTEKVDGDDAPKSVEDIMGSGWRRSAETTPVPEVKAIPERMEDLKSEIGELSVLQRKLRISTTLAGIAVRKMYSSAIEKATEERKSLSASFWHGKRAFEADFADLQSDLYASYAKLSHLETERENLSDQLQEIQRENGKLAHWQHLQERDHDRIVTELQQLLHVGDVNISQLLKRISEAHDTLAQLENETAFTERQWDIEVRAPMAKVERSKRRINSVRAESVSIRKGIGKRAGEQFNVTSELMDENARLHSENTALIRRLEEAEQMASELGVPSREIVDRDSRRSRGRTEAKLVIPEVSGRPSQHPASARTKRSPLTG
jgi:regulator of replication initiation timing